VAVIAEVAQQGLELLGPQVAQRALAEGLQGGLGVSVADRLDDAAELGLVGASEGPDRLCAVPPVQHPGGVGEQLLVKLLEALVAVAEQDVYGGFEEALSQAVEGCSKLCQRRGRNPQVLVGEPEAGGAWDLVTAGAPGVVQAPLDLEVAHRSLAVALLCLEPGGIHFADEYRHLGRVSCRLGGFLQFQQAAGAVELDGCPDQPWAEPGADPAAEGACGWAIVLLCGGGAGLLFQCWRQQSGGLVPEQDLR